MKYWSPIDPHVHLRWTEYADTDFLSWGIDDANAVGLAAVMEMGNTTPQVVNEATVRRRAEHAVERINEVPAYHERPAAYFIHPGLTDSILDAVDVFRLLKSTHNVRVRAAKLYTCHSTGRMGLTERRHRQNVWQVAAEVGWDGPVVVHAQDHTAFGPAFDPADPPSHARHQNEAAEIAGAEETLHLAHEAGFAGTVVVAHTSSPHTVDRVRRWLRDYAPTFRVVFEVTWHHLFLNVEDDYPVHGNRVKMNPPLTRRESQERLLSLVLAKPEDFMYGSDHAPHPLAAKDRLDPPPASGVPAIPFVPRGIALLREAGLGEDALRWVTFGHANEVFRLQLEPFEVETEYDPSRWDKYGWNPFSRLE